MTIPATVIADADMIAVFIITFIDMSAQLYGTAG
jgi:hypothetical protein